MHQEKWSNYYVSKLIQLIDLGFSPQKIAAKIPFEQVEILEKADQLGLIYIKETWLNKDP